MSKSEIVVLIALATLRVDGVKVLEGEKFEVDADMAASLVARRLAKRTRAKAKVSGEDGGTKVHAPGDDGVSGDEGDDGAVGDDGVSGDEGGDGAGSDDGVSGDGDDEDLFDDGDDAEEKETVGLSVKELRKIAKERGVTGCSSMNREQLIAALEV